MTPAARFQAVIEILSESGSRPLDRQLKDWFRGHRFAGSKDRHAITEQVYDIIRHRARYGHRMGAEDARSLVIAALLAEGQNLEAVFSGHGYGPAPLTTEERAAIARPPSSAPSWVVHEYPLWLEEELTRAFGDRLAEEMAAFQMRAPVDLRVNRLKATRTEILGILRADGFDCEIPAALADAIRCAPGVNLTAHRLYASGAFEIQDWAAQQAVALSGAEPGMRVLDLAAGAGGKSLALAAAMQNRGHLLAFDDKPERLAPLAERTARAGASIITIARTRGGPLWGDGRFDLVFLDVPCSGSGTWRRQPELKWRLTSERLAELQGIQDWLFADAARHTAPGGQLVYATCSILPRENEDRVAAFLKAHPMFQRVRPDFHASPAATASDGFYAAFLKRTV
jgi:16S rRNA (cytosine967-C5)-methyltransferase